jgi:hypothetical protein
MTDYNFQPVEPPKRAEEKIAGFLPFSPGAVAIGVLYKSVLKGDRKGFYLVRLLEPCTVNIDQRKEEHVGNKTGQSTAKKDELVGIRAVHATRHLNNPQFLGRIVRVEFLSTEARENKETKAPYKYHRIDIKIAAEDN